uniref:YqaJ viral recombinase domain-containing protein n=1 Tax=Nothobranchius rachovii TaxID=451742 RepID=A0A1A8RJT9_9TELE
MAAGPKLHKLQPQPLIASVLDGMSGIEVVPSKFGPVPRGCPISNLCPPEITSILIQHNLAPEFPVLPITSNDHITIGLCTHIALTVIANLTSTAPLLGAIPDGRVYDPTESPPFGLVEVKCTTKSNASQVAYLKDDGGNVILRQSHRYYWQVQGQLAVPGLEW